MKEKGASFRDLMRSFVVRWEMEVQTVKQLLVFAAVLTALVVLATPGMAESISHTLDGVFGEGTGTKPDPLQYPSITFDDGDSAGSVTITFSLSGLTNPNLSSSFVSGWYFNFSSISEDAEDLSFSWSSGDVADSISQANSPSGGTNKADGDGNYNVLFSFLTSSGNEFLAGETVVYTVTGTSITASDFDVDNDEYYTAVHLQGLGSGFDPTSTWLGSEGADDPTDPPDPTDPIPEPGTIVLLAGGIIGLAGKHRWRHSRA